MANETLYCYVAQVLPVLDDMACFTPNDAPITKVLMTDQTHPITGDPTLIASWTPRLSNSSDGSGTGANIANPIRSLTVINGAKPAASITYKPSQDSAIQIIQRSPHSITFKDEDTSLAKLTYYQGLQRNGNILLYYHAAPYLFGAKAGVNNGKGIKATIKPIFEIVPGTEIVQRTQCTIDWQAEYDPDFCISPF